MTDLNSEDKTGRTALMYAIIDNQLDKAHTLVHDADINAQDNHGFTALHFACQSQSAEATKLLLDSGATVEIEDTNGNNSSWTSCVQLPRKSRSDSVVDSSWCGQEP